MNIAFLSFPQSVSILLSELEKRFDITQKPTKQYGELLFFEDFNENLLKNSEGITQYPYWAKTTMTEPFFLHFETISQASGHLKNLQRNWAPYQFTCFRRAQLIQDKLPYINLKDRKFPIEIPASPIGLYTLIDEHNLIASAKTTSFLPAGTLHFIEDHENPPSRAYLKIQESLTMAHLLNGTPFPDENSLCFEAGACPGGWTWVLASLGAKVFAVDRAELAPSLMQNPRIKFLAHDAFTLKPQEISEQFGEVDWIFSDVICYPERLFEWILKWLDYNQNLNMICTIKMQGEIDWPLIQKFADIPQSRIVHLNYNKHELTWIHTKKEN